MHAATNANTDCLRVLIQSGASIATRNDKGVSAILLAAQASDDCLRALIDAGADIHDIDQNGRTAAMLATQHGHPATASLIGNLALARDETATLAESLPRATLSLSSRQRI